MDMRLVTGLTMLAIGALGAVPAVAASGPAPGTPEFIQRAKQNMADAYGRQTAPDGQFSPDYLATLPNSVPDGLAQSLRQADNPTRPIVDPGQWFPGWNSGNWYRIGWAGKRGVQIPIDFTNRYGSLLHGYAWGPLKGAKDPYTGKALKPPFPAVVITTGSIQGSEGM